jgi:phosphoglycolate phosphatase-like HAD superfamily hydrolase
MAVLNPEVLFDLDGTLVDSAPGIVASLTHAFAACGIEPPRGDWTRFIGPPLPQMLATALPSVKRSSRRTARTTQRSACLKPCATQEFAKHSLPSSAQAAASMS